MLKTQKHKKNIRNFYGTLACIYSKIFWNDKIDNRRNGHWEEDRSGFLLYVTNSGKKEKDTHLVNSLSKM